ncbi:MAG: hypothetical protein ABI901_15090, partial [Roseiflexaceae bacterium]
MKQDKRLLTDWAWLAAGVLGALLFFWHTVLPATQTHTYAFSAYYTAARLTLQGQAGIRFCDAWFFEQQRAFGFGNRADFFCPNPPTTALIMLPVAWLPPRIALAAWVACTLVLVAAIIAVGWRLVVAQPELLDWTNYEDRKAHAGCDLAARPVRASGLRFVALAAIVLLFYRPLHADLLASQVYSL